MQKVIFQAVFMSQRHLKLEFARESLILVEKMNEMILMLKL